MTWPECIVCRDDVHVSIFKPLVLETATYQDGDEPW